MAGAYTAVDLSQLPAPGVVETLEFEAIFAALLADLQARDSTFDALVESDPAYKILEVVAYREIILRQRLNEAARAVMIAFAAGPDLDHMAAMFGVTRLVVTPADDTAVPPVAAVMETDTAMRRRVQLSLEAFSVAGPAGAYVYHALSADAEILDASATSPTPGDVLVTILSATGDGTAGTELIEAVQAALDDETVRPLCDQVSVQSAEIVEFGIEATLFFLPGPDRAVVLAAAEAAAQAYALAQHRIGASITISGVYAALHQPGVQRVELVEPAASISISSVQASWCTGIVLTDGGVVD